MRALAFLTLLSFSLCPPLASAEKPVNPFVVLELFTSQGCSSCPPADKLLQKISAEAASRKQAIYALSYHVDYWNYLGWKDPYSNKSATDRQYAYAKALASGRVYTPQLVINGSKELVGSHGGKVRKEVARQLSKPPAYPLNITVDTNEKPKHLAVSYNCSRFSKEHVLRLALVHTPEKNKVRSGENRGRTLSHHNVVKAFLTEPLRGKKQGKVYLPVGELSKDSIAQLIAFVQHPVTMEIISATSKKLRQ